jgi:hypothetical protein
MGGGGVGAAGGLACFALTAPFAPFGLIGVGFALGVWCGGGVVA